jgi:DNA-directed RNA polymerase subunit RPC12/RpoP
MADDKKLKDLNVNVVYEGASAHIVAIPAANARRGQFTEPYLCSQCGQEGTIEYYKLAAGGTVECPECGGGMTRKGGA